MNILAFDTSTSSLSLALSYEGRLHEISFDYGLNHTEHVAVETQSLLEKRGISTEHLDLIGCVSGPGSFTGLRIGISFAKGLAYGAELPIVSVPSLDSFALAFGWFTGSVFPILDARKRRIYTAEYRNGKRQSEYLDISPTTLLEYLPAEDKTLLTGPYAEPLYSTLENQLQELSNPPFLDPFHVHLSGAMIIENILRAYEQKGGDTATSGPLYVRPSEAELAKTTKGSYEK